MNILEYLQEIGQHGKHIYPIVEEHIVQRWMYDMLQGDSDALVRVYLTAYLTEPNTAQLTLVNECRIALQHVEPIFKYKEYMDESKATITDLLKNGLGSTRTETGNNLPEGVRLIEGTPTSQSNTALHPGGSTVHRLR